MGFIKKIILLLVIAIALLYGLSFMQDTKPYPIETDGTRISRVVVFKNQRLMRLMAGDEIFREYKVALGGNPEGRKTCEGDKKTPEGIYTLDYRDSTGGYFLAYHISYPNIDDYRAAKNAGCEPGGDIMVHGLPNGLGFVGGAHSFIDWTNGCIAISNKQMNEFWHTVPVGTLIEIKP